MKKLIVAALSLILCAPLALADSPAPPISRVTASSDGRHFFKIVPGKRGLRGPEPSWGACYAIDQDGNFKEMWRTKGWYSFEVFLSDGGKYLVRMGPWNVGDRPSKNDLAVAFYHNGKILKEYSTEDLVDDPSSVSASISHYMWLARSKYYFDGAKPDPDAELRLDYDGIFRLKTIDGIKYEFDVKTGAIKSKSQT